MFFPVKKKNLGHAHKKVYRKCLIEMFSLHKSVQKFQPFTYWVNNNPMVSREGTKIFCISSNSIYFQLLYWCLCCNSIVSSSRAKSCCNGIIDAFWSLVRSYGSAVVYTVMQAVVGEKPWGDIIE